MAIQTKGSIIVKATPDRAYTVWSNFSKFPHFMNHIDAVEMTGDNRSHWTMTGPMGRTIEWNAETTLDEPNKRVAWSTKKSEDSDIKTSGQVTFNGLPNGETEVNVILQYDPPAGAVGDLFAKIFVNPDQKMKEDLRNFKRYIEGRERR